MDASRARYASRRLTLGDGISRLTLRPVDHEDAGLDIVHNRLQPGLPVSDSALVLKPVYDPLRFVGCKRHYFDRKAVGTEDRVVADFNPDLAAVRPYPLELSRLEFAPPQCIP